MQCSAGLSLFNVLKLIGSVQHSQYIGIVFKVIFM